jgi:hypothetical protein
MDGEIQKRNVCREENETRIGLKRKTAQRWNEQCCKNGYV